MKKKIQTTKRKSAGKRGPARFFDRGTGSEDMGDWKKNMREDQRAFQDVKEHFKKSDKWKTIVDCLQKAKRNGDPEGSRWLEFNVLHACARAANPILDACLRFDPRREVAKLESALQVLQQHRKLNISAVKSLERQLTAEIKFFKNSSLPGIRVTAGRFRRSANRDSKGDNNPARNSFFFHLAFIFHQYEKYQECKRSCPVFPKCRDEKDKAYEESCLRLPVIALLPKDAKPPHTVISNIWNAAFPGKQVSAQAVQEAIARMVENDDRILPW